MQRTEKVASAYQRNRQCKVLNILENISKNTSNPVKGPLEELLYAANL